MPRDFRSTRLRFTLFDFYSLFTWEDVQRVCHSQVQWGCYGTSVIIRLQAFGNCNRRLIQQVIDEYVDQRYHQIHREKRIIVADELKTVTLRIPSATAASVCPLGTAFTPERSTSATTPAAETVTELHFTAGIHTGGQSEPDASPESYPVYEKVLWAIRSPWRPWSIWRRYRTMPLLLADFICRVCRRICA